MPSASTGAPLNASFLLLPLSTIYESLTSPFPTVREPETAKQISSSVLKLLSTGDIRPIVHSTPYKGIEGVVQGLKDIEERKVWGKGVVVIREEETKAKL